MRKDKFISRIKSSLLQIDEGAVIILYGSRARGDNKSDSDWDILILTDLPESSRTRELFRDKIFDMELELEEPISTIIHNKTVWTEYEVTPFYQLISKEGKRI
jgi:predicted nucleotidyltransferase